MGGGDCCIIKALLDFYVPGCVFLCCDEGSPTLAAVEQSSFSLGSGHSSPPAASNRLSLENSGRARETSTDLAGDDYLSNLLTKDETAHFNTQHCYKMLICSLKWSYSMELLQLVSLINTNCHLQLQVIYSPERI